MIKYTCLLLFILPFTAHSQMLYSKDFIRLLQCDTGKQCFENILTGIDYYFLGEFDAVPREEIEALTDKDSIFMALCRQKARTYIYESNYMYTVGNGGRLRTNDRYHYQFCEQYNQVTYWTSVDMYPDIFIEKATSLGFTPDTVTYPAYYADKHFSYTDSIYTYHLFIKSYDRSTVDELGKVYYPRFQLRMRRERLL